MALSCKETIIHQCELDFAQVKHVCVKGSDFEIGQKLGSIAREVHGIQRTKIGKERSKQQTEYFRKNYPIHYERMKGLASVYGEEINDTPFDFSSYGNPVAAPACSAVFYPAQVTANGHSIISRNEDLPLIPFSAMVGLSVRDDEPCASSRYYVVEQYPDNGYPSLGMMSFELFGSLLDGINSEGLMVVHLAACDNATGHFKTTGTFQPGINEMLSVQLLLDNCKNTVEAKACLLLQHHYCIHIPIHLLVADRSGNSFIWEIDERGVFHIVEGIGKAQLITNFELHKYTDLGAFPSMDYDACPFVRYKNLDALVRQHDNFDIDTMKAINARVFITDYMMPKDFPVKVRTMYHQLYDANDASLDISFYLRDDVENKSGAVRSPYFNFRLNSY